MALRSVTEISRFRVLTLNDAVNFCDSPCIAHFIDFEAFDRCASSLARLVDALVVLPWYPHFNNSAKNVSLPQIARDHRVLQQLISEGRLHWYDLVTGRNRQGSFPVVSAKFFSAEAAFDLLASAGVKQVRSLGIDGGNEYSEEFSGASRDSLLSNGHRSFDRQFESFPTVIAKTGVSYAPLDIEAPIRCFVGGTCKERLPFEVLKFSITKHSRATVVVRQIIDFGVHIPEPVESSNKARTPFSFQRFLIPEISGYQGRAIYFDSDMIVFKDIIDLWRRPFNGSDLLSVSPVIGEKHPVQNSVMLLDCSRLNWNIKNIVEKLNSGELRYDDLMVNLLGAKVGLELTPEWNVIGQYSLKKTALYHYTDMPFQPWVSPQNPLGYLWVGLLREAIDCGAIPLSLVQEEVEKGHVRPTLLYQVQHRIDDSMLLGEAARQLDAGFCPPFRDIGIGDSVVSRIVGRARAQARLWREAVSKMPIVRSFRH